MSSLMNSTRTPRLEQPAKTLSEFRSWLANTFSVRQLESHEQIAIYPSRSGVHELPSAYSIGTRALDDLVRWEAGSPGAVAPEFSIEGKREGVAEVIFGLQAGQQGFVLATDGGRALLFDLSIGRIWLVEAGARCLAEEFERWGSVPSGAPVVARPTTVAEFHEFLLRTLELGMSGRSLHIAPVRPGFELLSYATLRFGRGSGNLPEFWIELSAERHSVANCLAVFEEFFLTFDGLSEIGHRPVRVWNSGASALLGSVPRNDGLFALRLREMIDGCGNIVLLAK